MTKMTAWLNPASRRAVAMRVGMALAVVAGASVAVPLAATAAEPPQASKAAVNSVRLQLLYLARF